MSKPASPQNSGKRGRRPPPEGRRFAPGQSGNPGGRPKVAAEVREAARALTDKAITTLEELLTCEENNVRLAAANSILDRGYGKPTQPVVATDEEELRKLSDAELVARAKELTERVEAQLQVSNGDVS